MSEWLHVGQKVVCVDDSPGLYGNGGLVLGRIYTISAIEPKAFPELAVQISELYFDKNEFARASRFRPLRKRSTDISIFKEMLVSPPKARVDA